MRGVKDNQRRGCIWNITTADATGAATSTIMPDGTACVA